MTWVQIFMAVPFAAAFLAYMGLFGYLGLGLMHEAYKGFHEEGITLANVGCFCAGSILSLGVLIPLAIVAGVR